MTDERRYSAFAKKPAEGSMYAFLAEGFSILNSDVIPSMGYAPMPITDDMHPDSKAYWQRWNPALAQSEDLFRAEAIERLRATGIPESLLAEPLGPAMERVVMGLVDGWRWGLMLQEEWRLQEGRPPINPRHQVEPQVRVLAAAAIALRGKTKAAEFLNQDGPRQVRSGLTRDHIARASKKFDRWLLGLRDPRVMDVELRIAVDTFLALVLIYRQARKRPEFRGIKGADLAWAIHERHDLHQRFERAHAMVTERVAA
jgi:hypothetical protein